MCILKIFVGFCNCQKPRLCAAIATSRDILEVVHPPVGDASKIRVPSIAWCSGLHKDSSRRSRVRFLPQISLNSELAKIRSGNWWEGGFGHGQLLPYCWGVETFGSEFIYPFQVSTILSSAASSLPSR